MRATIAWPEGVIARYLTHAAELLHDAELTVDVTYGDAKSTATCRGCGDCWSNDSYYTNTVKNWAQQHAEKCRALPRPTA
ncbi:hypothetical protein [Streptomyces sp. HD]|uniref:hypothetical protein n=1 Tax=Streptomyces sp. HD TaxID=3020892 RepID=UPI00232E778F|nr:hypothetical protein [Streptomyces sp. HD]MDC0768381.1 hypothetical protein [Streptomyces sp. HD]